MTALIGGKTIHEIIQEQAAKRASAAEKAKAQRIGLMEEFLKAGMI